VLGAWVVKKENLDLLGLLERLVRQERLGLRDLQVLLEHLQIKINHGNRGIFSKREYTLFHIGFWMHSQKRSSGEIFASMTIVLFTL
jgi:hypothetical protein